MLLAVPIPAPVSRSDLSNTADGGGQSADLVEKLVRGLVEVQGVTNDLHARASDDVACRRLVAASVDQVASSKTEDGAVSEELVKVGVRDSLVASPPCT